MTAKQQIGQLRKIYFACAKRLGLDEDTRHAFNGSVCGEPSTKRWQLGNWNAAVAELQRQCGQEVEGDRPRVKAPHPGLPPNGGKGEESSGPNALATVAQIRYIEGLRDQIHWTHGFDRWVRKRVLSIAPFRATTWSGRLEELFKAEATAVVNGLNGYLRSLAS